MWEEPRDFEELQGVLGRWRVRGPTGVMKVGVQEMRTLGTENLNFVPRAPACFRDSGWILQIYGVWVFLGGSFLTQYLKYPAEALMEFINLVVTLGQALELN